MSIKWMCFSAALALAAPALAAPGLDAPCVLHRGDYVKVQLLNGTVYHLRLSGADGSSLVGRSGSMSVHLRRDEIAQVQPEAAPREVMQAPSATTAMLSLLSLSAASMSAARNFGAGHACNGSTSGC